MPKFRLPLCLASIALASSLTGGLAVPSAAARPAPAETMRIEPLVRIDRAALRAKLAERRAVTFARFLAYREARVYPVNRIGPGLRHIWVDDLGNLCAAATIISGDWGYEATARVGRANLQIRLSDVTSGPVADWMAASGLTRHELIAIQLPGDDLGRRVRPQEIDRVYNMYVDVERQIRSLWDENLELAVDALLKRPELARAMLAGKLPGPGVFARPAPGERVAPPVEPAPAPEPEPMPAPEPEPMPAFAQPPPAAQG